MNQQTQETLRAAEEAVTRLVEQCGKAAPMYEQEPRKAAQVSRTGKRPLNAVAALREGLTAPQKKEATCPSRS